MNIKNQRHFFLSCILTSSLLTGSASVQAFALLTGTPSVQTVVLLVGISAAEMIDENGDLNIDSLGLSLAELFDLEVSIATGVKQTIARAPAITSVITAQDIEAIGATDLDEVLKTVPGLHVSKNYIIENSIYAIRGMHSTYNPEVLVLINGISIKTLFLGNRQRGWGGMPVNAISRIEIVRGPGSAMFGADAFSGVINIITKTKEEINGTEVGVRAGEFDRQDAWILHGSTWKGFDIAASLEFHNTDGHREIIEADAQPQILQRIMLILKLDKVLRQKYVGRALSILVY